jgi:class 3 adenylate cyclase
MRLQPILDQIVETTARLCRADSGFLYGALGAVTNLAARLSDEAAHAQILLGQRIYAARSKSAIGLASTRPSSCSRLKEAARLVD